MFLPNWPTDRLRRRRGTPGEATILLVSVDHGRQVIAHCCPRSAACGVAPGLTLAHARALLSACPATIEAAHDPRRDEAALRSLAAWAIRYSPLVSPDPPDGLLLDVTGCHRLYRDEHRLLDAIGRELRRLGFTARLACAGTIGCAWAAARHGGTGEVVVLPGREREALGPLPIESLRVDRRIAEALHEVNVDRVGQVLALPRRELAARYPADLLRRIDQAVGDAVEMIEPLRPREPVMIERTFDGAATQLESLLIAGRELIDKAAAALAQIECGALRMTMRIARLGGEPAELELRLSRPSRDPRHLWSLLRPRLEAVNMHLGVEGMTLTVAAAQRLAHRQESSWIDRDSAAAAGERAWGELIDTLSHRLGAERAVCTRLVESHLPERSTRRVAAMDAAGSAKRSSSPATPVTGDRPSLLLERPEPIDAKATGPDGPPSAVRWRGVEHRLVAARGPHRLAEEWWRDEQRGVTREYFAVQDDAGRWLWVFRAVESGRWFIHGQWA